MAAEMAAVVEVAAVREVETAAVRQARLAPRLAAR